MKDAEFEARNRALISEMGQDEALRRQTLDWMQAANGKEYSYHFRWMGLPIIQYPQDILAMQELLWTVKPDLVIETGVARGGSLIFYASMLELLGGDREVVGVDIDIRAHNREAIEAHPMAKRIHLIQGSSVDPAVVAQVAARAKGRKTVMVLLDSNHTHAHVAKELEAYAPFVTKGSYLVVFDTIIEFFPKAAFTDRPWGPGDNPWSAAQAFLKGTDRFVIDRDLDSKLQISVAPEGYLRCVKG